MGNLYAYEESDVSRCLYWGYTTIYGIGKRQLTEKPRAFLKYHHNMLILLKLDVSCCYYLS